MSSSRGPAMAQKSSIGAPELHVAFPIVVRSLAAPDSISRAPQWRCMHGRIRGVMALWLRVQRTLALRAGVAIQ